MESEAVQSRRTKMESLRTICDRELPVIQQKIDSFTMSFHTSLHSIKALAMDNAEYHATVAKTKANLREAENELVKVLAALEKAQQEAKHEIEENGETQEAISWYNRVLGFQIEGGHGVKFTLTDINIKNLKQEYSFTIRHANDIYLLLDCNPHFNGVKELINELNRTNGLFKFVRIMREKLQELAALELQPQSTSFHQDFSAISMSGPALSISTARSEFSAKNNEHHIPLQDVNMQFKKVNHGSKSPAKINENQIHDGELNRHPKKVAKSDILSPSVRRSPRLKAKK